MEKEERDKTYEQRKAQFQQAVKERK